MKTMNDLGQFLDGSFGRDWTMKSLRQERVTDGEVRLIQVRSPRGRSFHRLGFKDRPWSFQCELPLPTVRGQDKMELETLALPKETSSPGPITGDWLEYVSSQMDMVHRANLPGGTSSEESKFVTHTIVDRTAQPLGRVVTGFTS